MTVQYSGEASKAREDYLEAVRKRVRASESMDAEEVVQDVMLAVFGKVASPYWQHNPGSEAHLPKPLPWVMPTLTTDETAAAIVAGIERNKRLVVKPAIFRVLHLLYALFPRLTVRAMSGR